MDFTHLHLHTGYSLADASLKSKHLAKRIKEFGMKSVAITDHGNLFGVIDFYKACIKEGVKPILGIETYVAPNFNTSKESGVDDANYHLVLLAETNEGFQNIMQISSDAALNGFYYKARTDKTRLREFSRGVIALSACIGGEVQFWINKHKDYERAKSVALQYDSIFGRGNFYLELQSYGSHDRELVNAELIRMSRETGIPLVCTNDCHYLEAKDAESHDILMAIQASTTIYDTKRKKYDSDQFYVKSPIEMYEMFSYIPEAFNNTTVIANRCNVTIEFGKNKLPRFDVPDGYDKKGYLRELVYLGANKLYSELTPEILERIEYELSTIERMGYQDYFLIVWDFIRYARENGILVGPGRGSGAGSIVTYSLFITKLDPLRYGLLFERFLDPSRISMPDLDLDFQDDRRHEVIEYVVHKYGRNSIAQIITFGSMAARSAIRAVGRALNYPFAAYDVLAKMIPAEPGITLRDAIAMVPELSERYSTHVETTKLLDAAMSLEGLPLYTGTHAAGVLITDELGVSAHVPMWRTDKGIVAQWSMGFLEDLGLLKMDFLGLSTLTVISRTIAWIKQNYGVDVDLEKLYECEDLAPLVLLRDGYTDGLFQVEGGGMTQFMTELRPKTIEDVILGISIYRPGPKQYIPKLLANRRNESGIVYVFNELKPILKATHGILCYQEQCMQAVIAIAGYQKHHSDGFRKAIGKKIAYLIQEHRGYFIEGREETDKLDAIPGGVRMGHDLAKLEKFYDEMEDFGKYCFNKSHGAVYAVIAYITAWLKYYYPTEFMSALMDSVAKDKVRVGRYINHCRKDLGISIALPDILTSMETFVPEKGKKIIYSLSAKGVSENNIKEICQNRNVSSMYEFFENNYMNIDKTTLEALVCIGAFSRLSVVKSRYIAALEDITDTLGKIRSAKKRAEEPSKLTKTGKPSRKKPFDFRERFDLDSMIPEIMEFPEEQNLKIEKQFLGLYLSGHPLDRYSFSIENFSDFKTSDIDYEIDDDTGEVIIIADNIIDSKEIKFIGVLNAIKKIITKKHTIMANLDVEDLYGSCKVTVFPELFKSLESVLKEDEVYVIRGKIQCRSGEIPGVICTHAQKLSQLVVKRMIITMDSSNMKEVISHLDELKVSGTTPIYLEHKGMRVLLPKEYWVDTELFLMYRDRNLITDNNILTKEW